MYGGAGRGGELGGGGVGGGGLWKVPRGSRGRHEDDPLAARRVREHVLVALPQQHLL